MLDVGDVGPSGFSGKEDFFFFARDQIINPITTIITIIQNQFILN
jgi:hypothetical protein